MLISFFQLIMAMLFGINLFVIMLYAKQKNEQFQLVHRLGIVIMMVWAIRYFLFYIKFEEWVLQYPFLLVLDQYFLLLDGLLLWLYSKAFIVKRFTLKSILHFTPFALLLATALYYALSNPAVTRTNFNDSVNAIIGESPIIQPAVMLFFALVLIVSVIYLLKSRKEVQYHSETLKDNYSNIERINIDWVITYQKLWLILFIMPLVFYSLNYIYPLVSIVVSGSVLIGSMAFLSLYFNFHLLSQKHVTLKKIGKTQVKAMSLESTTDQESDLLARLFDGLSSEKYYEDEQLSLNQLAEKMDLKPVELTHLIKKSPYENFYDLVNSFRIEAVKKALQQSDEQVIVIAYQCGFNSKSTFNKIFKEKTGLTPKEFRNNSSA